MTLLAVVTACRDQYHQLNSAYKRRISFEEYQCIIHYLEVSHVLLETKETPYYINRKIYELPRSIVISQDDHHYPIVHILLKSKAADRLDQLGLIGRGMYKIVKASLKLSTAGLQPTVELVPDMEESEALELMEVESRLTPHLHPEYHVLPAQSLFTSYKNGKIVTHYTADFRGNTLESLINTPLSQERRICIATTLVESCCALFRSGFTHGDLHSGNVLVDDTNTARIADFATLESCSSPHYEARKSGDLFLLEKLLFLILIGSSIPKKTPAASITRCMRKVRSSFEEGERNFMEVANKMQTSSNELNP